VSATTHFFEKTLFCGKTHFFGKIHIFEKTHFPNLHKRVFVENAVELRADLFELMSSLASFEGKLFACTKDQSIEKEWQ